MGTLRKILGTLVTIVVRLAILALIVNTIGGGWGFVLLCAVGAILLYAARRFEQRSA